MLAVIPGVTRVVRGAVLSEKNNQYIEAARASGAWTPRVVLRHVLPNILALGIIVMTTLLGGIILAESALAFLGLGIPGATSWGQDVSKAREFLPYHMPAAIFPGLAITLDRARVQPARRRRPRRLRTRAFAAAASPFAAATHAASAADLGAGVAIGSHRYEVQFQNTASSLIHRQRLS